MYSGRPTMGNTPFLIFKDICGGEGRPVDLTFPHRRTHAMEVRGDIPFKGSSPKTTTIDLKY